MIRLLMTSANDSIGIEACYKRGLVGQQCVTKGVPVRNPGAAADKLHRRVLGRFLPEFAFPEVNARLMAEVMQISPDVVWVFKGMEVYPSTLRNLRKRGFTLVNYNPDHPFNFFSRGTGNRNVRLGIPFYHLHMTFSRLIARELAAAYHGCEVKVVPFGHEVDDEVFARISNTDEILRACFLGNPDEHRRRSILRLVEAGLAIDVFGHRWQNILVPSDKLRLNGPVTGEEMLRTLRRYRVQLNFFRPHNAESHNMRSFEVPAAGGIMLAEDSQEHRDFFEVGKEAFFFRTEEEMIGLTRQILAMPKAEADAVRAAARHRSTTSGYMYRDRAAQVLAHIAAVRAVEG